MANLVAQLRQSGSFVAGVLIGISIVIATFAVADNNHGRWPIVLAFVAPVILLIGIALQARITSGSRRHLRAAPEARQAKIDGKRLTVHPGPTRERAAGLSHYGRAGTFAVPHADAEKCATSCFGFLR